ncbi:MAG: adenylate kinase [Actinomycetota bacterium]|nr:adenylate kinase [Nocardioidaceae bacterium]MDQ3479966.1 adenylate kinase [Actinomycetota bacterium]
MRVVLVGAPGAGKGTQAKFISQHFAIPSISTGEMFRANLAAETELGKAAKRYMDAGDLVPDEVTIGIVSDRLVQRDTGNGFLLDGFPRTPPQAEALSKLLADRGTPLDVVLELQVDSNEVVRRLSGRRTCRTCEHVWHLDFDPPREPGTCDVDGGELFQRDDDLPETILRRLDVYAEQTAPLVDYYRDAGLLQSITAQGEVDEITQLAIEALESALRR